MLEPFLSSIVCHLLSLSLFSCIFPSSTLSSFLMCILSFLLSPFLLYVSSFIFANLPLFLHRSSSLPFLCSSLCFLQIFFFSRLSLLLFKYFSLLFMNLSLSAFFPKFFRLLLFEGTFTSVLKDKNSKRSHKSRNQGFSYFFCLLMESGSVQIIMRIRIGGAQKHPDQLLLFSFAPLLFMLDLSLSTIHLTFFRF